METEERIWTKYEALSPSLNELSRRIWAATEAQALGYGGISLVARATGISRNSIFAGKRDISSGTRLPEGHVRRSGGGRKANIEHQPDLQA